MNTSIHRLAKALNAASPDTFSKWSQQDVDSAVQLARNNWFHRQKMVLSWSCGALVGVALFALMLYELGASPSIVLNSAVLSAFAMLATAALTSEWVCGLWGAKAAEQVLHELSPLRLRQNLCEQALRVLDCPACRDYRDRVVAGGRELVRRDLAIMQDLSEDWLHELAAERRRQLCQQVHGLLEAKGA